MDVLGLDHVDLTATDLARSTDYYALFFADPDGLKLERVHFPWGYWRRVQSDGSDERPRWAPRGG